MEENEIIQLGGVKTSPKHIQFHKKGMKGLVLFKFKKCFYTDANPTVKIDNLSTLELVYTKHFGGLMLADHKLKQPNNG
ncbi:hypothetical protein [Sphingobacterium mizutaii]|uniref:hypothetical protein n=1 Tax=Sphingobacterium mizutaii TaxID=1010 RepID=UPI0028A1DF80|nr:hypothetical protein [Sphingobacterium mizutaii]